jgi:hypothetical protein
MDLIEQKKISPVQFKRHPWETVRFKALLFLLKKITDKNFIVDIGSGDAFVASELAKRFPASQIVAVDINYDDKFIKENDKSNLFFLKSAKDIPVAHAANVMLLMDVLEHIEKPEELLRAIKQLKNVSSSTQFIITVPAFQSLFTEHDVFLKHFRRYKRKQVSELLQRESYNVKYSGYFFFTLFLVRFLQKFFAMKQEHKVHTWNGNNFITSLMINILWIDFKICWYLSRIGINLPGLSCYCICHPLPS